eukprot:COSAG06_NODE_15343_length_1078_cov_6.883555_1_plen_44_part_10
MAMTIRAEVWAMQHAQAASSNIRQSHPTPDDITRSQTHAHRHKK